ncbi:MAG: 3'-5' exonuclease [Bacteroidetes bacterium]|nr:3'-5' exonuclease [Bacteroidota bacterium]MBS1632575.1 3'-5' exonuclease [Bacteroidota bacterium]
MSSFPLNNILFLDIETVPQYSSYTELSEEWRSLWNHKATFLLKNKEDETAESIYPRAGIYAEFGKVVCVGCGVLSGNRENRKIIVKCFSGDNEKLLLTRFAEMLNMWSPDGTKHLCAHNGKEFDFPYLCRRFVVNQIPIPSALQLSGKKPWEVNHLDTLELWKFGDFKNFTSLNLLAHILGVPTPKDDIDGSMVWEVYWKEKNLERIVTYCQKDVVTVAQIYLRMVGEPLIKNENIETKS